MPAQKQDTNFTGDDKCCTQQHTTEDPERSPTCYDKEQECTHQLFRSYGKVHARFAPGRHRLHFSNVLVRSSAVVLLDSIKCRAMKPSWQWPPPRAPAMGAAHRGDPTQKHTNLTITKPWHEQLPAMRQSSCTTLRAIAVFCSTLCSVAGVHSNCGWG
jgi:hypothetical protein